MKVILEAQHACTPMPRGISYYTFRLIRQLLIRKRYEYELTFFDENRERNNRQWIDKYFGEFNVPIHECNTLNYRRVQSEEDVFGEKSYNEYASTFGDVFHFMHLMSIPDHLKGQMIVTIHDMLPMRFPEFYSSIDNRKFRLGMKRLEKMQPIVITDSMASKEDILCYTDMQPERVYVVPLGFDEQASWDKDNSEIVSLGVDASYMLYLGAIDKRKNIVRILEAFEAFSKHFPDVKLVLAGPFDPNAESIASRMKSSVYYGSKIVMLGYVTEEQKYSLYSNALAFLYPSFYEGFGLPVLEAMASGCPVITSNVSSLPEVAGDATILIDPYDTEQLAYEMERLVSNESLRQELMQKGLEQSEKFSWEKTAAMTEDVYRIAMEGGIETR